MAQIILNQQQTQAIHDATDSVELRDEQGNLLGYIARPIADDEVVKAKRRLNSNGPWYTTEEVVKHLAESP